MQEAIDAGKPRSLGPVPTDDKEGIKEAISRLQIAQVAGLSWAELGLSSEVSDRLTRYGLVEDHGGRVYLPIYGPLDAPRAVLSPSCGESSSFVINLCHHDASKHALPKKIDCTADD